jgi:carbamoylphosphate synthase small subunit
LSSEEQSVSGTMAFLARDNMDVTTLALNDNPVESINNTSTETLSSNLHAMEKNANIDKNSIFDEITFNKKE